MLPELTIQILGHNGAEYLVRAIEALRKIPKGEVVIRYIDNASTDGSVEVVRRALPKADIIQSSYNSGYTRGHNLGLALCTTPFVLLHDQDVVIEWKGIKKLLEAFADLKVGGVQGKVYRKSQTLRPNAQIFDSAGIVQTLSLNGVDRGSNLEDRGQFDESAEIFGLQGGCALYRIEALLAVAYTRDSSAHINVPDAARDVEIPDVLDEDFFAYKDDVDLGWRLSQAGWSLLYQPEIMGYHARTLGKRGVGGWGFSPKGIFGRLKSPRTRLSLRNYCWMIIKNASLGQVIWRSPFIFLRLKIFFWLSVFYPPLFSVWKETWQGILLMLAKRP